MVVEQVHLLQNVPLRRHPRHKRFCLVQVNADIVAHGCTSWLRDVPAASAERAPDAPRALIMSASIVSQPRGCSIFHLIIPADVQALALSVLFVWFI